MTAKTDQFGFASQGVQWTAGGPIPVFNDLKQFEGFYLSYNYRGHTSAICGENGGFFMVLKGDHRQGLAAAAEEGPPTLAAYFADHIAQATKESEHPSVCGLAKDPLNARKYALEVFSEADLQRIADAVTKGA